MIDSLTPDVVDRLRRGVETGRWPDGRALTPEQREHSLNALIAWGERKLPPEERVGYIDRGAKAAAFAARRAPQPLRWSEGAGNDASGDAASGSANDAEHDAEADGGDFGGSRGRS
jgi:uncharacterized protein YeaC (DUF1315 family)